MTQTTFLMIKPDGIHHETEILKILNDHGLKIESKVRLNVDMKVMATLLIHYEDVIDNMGKAFNFVGKLFNAFYFGNHELIPMKVSYEGSDDIIELTRTLVGATNPEKADDGTLRNLLSQDNYVIADSENRLVHNVIHASDSHESASRELEIWSQYFNA